MRSTCFLVVGQPNLNLLLTRFCLQYYMMPCGDASQHQPDAALRGTPFLYVPSVLCCHLESRGLIRNATFQGNIPSVGCRCCKEPLYPCVLEQQALELLGATSAEETVLNFRGCRSALRKMRAYRADYNARGASLILHDMRRSSKTAFARIAHARKL